MTLRTKLLLGLGAVLVVGGLVVFALPLALFPSAVHVERSTTIDAPPCNVFALVNSHRRFDDWSPWHGLDPEMQATLQGPAEGPGARYAWVSDDPAVGSGSMEIVASTPCEQVDQALDFGPNGLAKASFRLEPADAGTKVTWTLDTDVGNNPIARWFALGMDGMIGPDYERGLAKLKQLAEGLPKGDLAGVTVEEVSFEGRPAAWVVATSANDPGAIGMVLGTSFAQVRTYVAAAGLTVEGAPMAEYGGEGDMLAIRAILPLAAAPTAPLPPDPAVQIGTLPAGKYVRIEHVGGSDTLPDTVARLDAWLAVRDLASEGDRIEEYLTDAASTPSAQRRTAIYARVP